MKLKSIINKWRENVFVLLIASFGFLWINRNIGQAHYTINEFWFIVLSLNSFAAIFMGLDWKKMVAVRWVLSIYFLVRMTQIYDETSFILYLTVIISTWIYTIECLMIAKQLKEVFDLLQENKKLTHTIKTILQTFPEGVIIRTPDQVSNSVIIKFTNDFIKHNFSNTNSEQPSDISSTQVNIVHEKDNSSSLESEDSLMLDEFLWSQETMFINSQLEDQQSVENIIEVRRQTDNVNVQPNDNEQDSQCQVFNVKTIQVLWANNPSSFMHVFINTTQVRKVEEMKAKNKWQKLMFASATHEFRTPLNAFVNSLQIIDMTIESLKQKLTAFDSARSSWEQFYPTLDKMITIGRISSKLQLNLVEDILDLAKFDANRFELNISEFKLKEIVDEINSIFQFQCKERKIEFGIEWSNNILEKQYRSDPKRIKQVIINLVSNSLKFTMKGHIIVSVREVERKNKNYLEFKVLDTGIGIKQEDIGKLFMLFSMIDKNRRLYNQSGTGIGLSISK